LSNSYKNGNDPKNISLESLEPFIEGLDAEAVKKAANKYFNMDSYIQVTLVPETTNE